MPRHLLLALLITLTASFSFQTLSAQGPPGGHAKMRKRIEDLRKVKLLDILNLQGEQVEEFFAIYNRNQAKFHELRQEIDSKSNALQEAIEEGASDSDLELKTKKLRVAVQAMEESIENRFDDVRTVLSTKQYAQYVVFESRFRDELQRMILDRMRRMRGR